MNTHRLRTILVTALAAAATSASAARGQGTTFSIDWHGPSNTVGPCAGGPAIQPADLLRPNTVDGVPDFAVPAPPCMVTRGGAAVGTLGLPAYPVFGEVDALSYGADAQLESTMPAGSFRFSVDEFAWGAPFVPQITPSVETQWPVGDVSASAFTDTGIPAFPYDPALGAIANVELIDGDGNTAPGLGLVEPNPPGTPPDAGDNLDALDTDRPPAVSFVLFSLDGAMFDPLSGAAGTGSAVNNGFLPGQILISNLSGAAPIVWAPAVQLGLTAADDIDALAVWDNGNQAYDPVTAPFDWLQGAGDMVLFSLRRGSATIGALDSQFGVQIEEGDVLMPPIAGGTTPAIVVPGEALGLATRRSGTARAWGPAGVLFADDLDALDVAKDPMFDCNGNGLEDALDIVLGAECDFNKNGTPDSCEIESYCTAGTSASGCNATLSASGVPSLSLASGFVLAAASVEGNKDGIFYYGLNGAQAVSWGNGTSYQCVVPPVIRTKFMSGVGTAGACDGSFSIDLNAGWSMIANPAKIPPAGGAVHAQLWFRDPGNTSSMTTSLSDAMRFTVCP